MKPLRRYYRATGMRLLPKPLLLLTGVKRSNPLSLVKKPDSVRVFIFGINASGEISCGGLLPHLPADAAGFRYLPSRCRHLSRSCRTRAAHHLPVLVPFLKVAFHHHTHNGFLTTGNLLCHIGAHIHLTLVLFAAVSVAEIDHDTRCQTGLCQPFFYRTDIFRAVVRFLPPRRMIWQSPLPVVFTMAECPHLVTDRKQCGDPAALMASMATLMVPSVPF